MPRLAVRQQGGSGGLATPNSAARMATASSATLSPGSGSFTFAWWERRDVSYSGGVMAIVAYGNGTTTGWTVVEGSTDGSKIDIYVKAGSATLSTLNARPPLGQWARFVAVIDASDHSVRLYRNGALLNASAAAAWSGSFTASDILYLGHNPTTPYSCGGYMADCVYDVGTAWTLAQVQADYYQGKQPATVTHRWPLDDGAGSTARATVGGLAMTLSSGAVFSTDSPMLARGVVRNGISYADRPDLSPWIVANLTVNGAYAGSMPTAAGSPTTAVQFTDTGGVSSHQLTQANVFCAVGVGVIVSTFVKRVGGNSWFRIDAAGGRAWFDIATGAVGTYDSAASGSGIRDVGNGWYLIWIVVPLATSTTCNFYTTLTNGGSSSIAANGTSFAVAGAQSEPIFPGQTTPSPYVATGAAPLSVWGAREYRQNLLYWSEDLSNTIYTKAGSTITPNATMAPDGTVTADRITLSSATGQAYQQVSTTALERKPWVLSAFAKPDGANLLGLNFQGNAGFYASAIINLATGQVTETVSSGTGSDGTVMQILKSRCSALTVNGFYRASLAILPSTPGAGNIQYVSLFVPPLASGNVFNTAGIATGATVGATIYLWGVQLANANDMAPYIATTSAPANASGAPRSQAGVRTAASGRTPVT